MALDNVSLSIIVREMEREIPSAVLSKPFALSAHDYALPYTRYTEEGKLVKGTIVFSLDPSNPYLCYSFDRYQKVEDNAPFFNSLKKLSFGKVRAIRKLDGERVVTLSIESDRRDITEINDSYDLILELFPNHPNAYIIAYPYGRIVSLYRERVDLENGILLTRNASYSYPKARPTLRADSTPDDCRKYLSNACFKRFEAYASKVGYDKALQDLLSSSSLYCIDGAVFPLSFGEEKAEPLPVSSIYNLFVSDQKDVARISRVKELLDLINKAVKAATKKLSNLEEDYKKAAKYNQYLEYGQMLYLYQSEIRKGDKVLKRDGYEIPLDPRLDAVKNANRYFKKYSKGKAAVQILSDLQKKTKDEIEYLEKKQMEAKDGTPRDIQELKSELLEEGYIKEKQGKKTAIAKVSKKKSYDPHYLRLDNGVIAFGMNGLQNENLTFKIAKKDDLFVHVKDYPGSHVLVLEGKDDPEVVKTACELALFLSHLESGEVLLADRKQVKKNPEKIGLVHILKYETLNIKSIREQSRRSFEKALKF